MRILCIAALSLAACAGVNTGQSTRVLAPPEAQLGHGYDSLSGDMRGACVAPRPVNRTRSGGMWRRHVFFARSREEVARQVGFSGGVSLGLSDFGLDLGLENLDRRTHRRATTFTVIQISFDSPGHSLVDYRLQDGAAATLRREGAHKFYEGCGDGFVAAVRSGGLFLGIVALEEVADAELQRVSGGAGVSFFGFGVRAGAGSETRQFFARHRARYYVLQNGGGPGGWNSVSELQDIDVLVQRAQAFEREVQAGATVPTQLIVKPYQVISNLPRGATLWNLLPQQRFLDALALRHGELKRADDEVQSRIAAGYCKRRGDARELERLHARYAPAIEASRKRAQDCQIDPRRSCSDRGLTFVDPPAHARALARCEPPPPPVDLTPPPPPPQPGVDAPCHLWQFSSLSVRVASREYDADGSAPELIVSLHSDGRQIGLPTVSSYSHQGELTDLYLKPGAAVTVSIWDRDLMVDDHLASLAGNVPPMLPSGQWTLGKGETRAVLAAQCRD
ncbi:hypothetical protein [Nannocystis bainbridge]|uniref:Lipoprotein n=1 Tax=Nannocystis bainbridge TaxID=2995303 RepID=A0ABT5E782_9BACT|nr:hypothetical protein [Nannocystis bainbridge]MDC0721288.1 hypothetical protein [Nannocystis bainbridge]